MKIAYITHVFPPTGYAAALNTYRLVKGLADRGHELLVFCPKNVSKYADRRELLKLSENCPFDVCYSLPTPLPLSVIIPHLHSAIRVLLHKYDLLITQFHLYHLASVMGLLLKLLKGRPWMVKVHDMIPDPALRTTVSERGFINELYGMYMKAYYGAFLRNIGKKADRILVLTTELQRLLIESGYSSDKVAIIPNGVDTQIFSPSISKGNSPDKKTILYIGSMMPEDGLTCMVKAFALLNSEEESHLTLIGDGPERIQLIDLVRKLNLKQKVTFYKYVPHELIPKFIKDAYITVGPLCLSPANNYTIPTKILEYFACEKPVISAPVSRDILIDGFTGLVVKDVTPKNVAKKFSILMEDEKLTAQMGKNARQLVVERFDWERIIDRIEKECKTLKPPHRIS